MGAKRSSMPSEITRIFASGALYRAIKSRRVCWLTAMIASAARTNKGMATRKKERFVQVWCWG